MGKKETPGEKLEKRAEKLQTDVSNLAKAQKLFQRAETLSKEREAEFQKLLSKEKDGQWYLTALKQGTISDKISALSMLVQREPTSTIGYLMQLLQWAKKPNQKVQEQAICCIRDLLTKDSLAERKTLSLF